MVGVSGFPSGHDLLLLACYAVFSFLIHHDLRNE